MRLWAAELTEEMYQGTSSCPRQRLMLAIRTDSIPFFITLWKRLNSLAMCMFVPLQCGKWKRALKASVRPGF